MGIFRVAPHDAGQQIVLKPYCDFTRQRDSGSTLTITQLPATSGRSKFFRFLALKVRITVSVTGTEVLKTVGVHGEETKGSSS